MIREAVPMALGTVGSILACIAGGMTVPRSPRSSWFVRWVGWTLFAVACLLIGAAIGWTP